MPCCQSNEVKQRQPTLCQRRNPTVDAKGSETAEVSLFLGGRRLRCNPFSCPRRNSSLCTSTMILVSSPQSDTNTRKLRTQLLDT